MSIQAQQGSAGGMPVPILKEGASQTKGRDAQKNNITAKLIAEIYALVWVLGVWIKCS